MRYKIIVGVLVLALLISLGFNVYHYLAMVEKQKLINDIRSEIILEWANEMSIAADHLENATTNIDVDDEHYGVRWFLYAASRIVHSISMYQLDESELFGPMAWLPLDVAGNLAPYEEGARAPIIVRHINPTALEMFGNLAEKIWNVTDLIFNEASTLYSPTGVNPIKRLEEKDILDDIIDGCEDIRSYSSEIHDFNPKFQ